LFIAGFYSFAEILTKLIYKKIMKKMFKRPVMLVVAMFAFMAISNSVNAQSSNDEALIGKARGAAHDCLNTYLSNGIAVDASVETTGICFVSGELHKVVFYTTVRCHNEPCPKPASVLIATVYFDCDNNATSVECAN
jgi:hypothetical protein